MSPSESRPIVLPKHFYSLDVLRGLAALSVVFWHWQHFFYQGTKLGEFDRSRQPFFDLFMPFYTNGARAVDLFFCLSGFIFFWLYGGPIRRRETSWKEFVVLRFSRLYPLHFATLLFVAAGQWLVRSWQGAFFVYPYNDLHHFFLQLFLASNWGLQEGYSFNYPVWSVSIEMLCYAVFFVVCLLKSDRWWHLLMFVGIGVVLQWDAVNQMDNFSNLGRGVFSFFAGGLTFRLFTAVVRRGVSRGVLQVLTVLAAASWIVVPSNIGDFALFHLYRDHLWRPGFDLFGQDMVGFSLRESEASAIEWLLFPLTIITLGLWEVRRGTLGKRLAPLGHISYSAYLLHFPLQLVFFGVAARLAVPNTVFYSPWALGLFFLVLIPLSLASYRYFERPCQKWLRTRLSPRPAGAREHYPSTPLAAAGSLR